jgi:prepilin-type N-terminal cleavage/methylation domain-containing protein
MHETKDDFRRLAEPRAGFTLIEIMIAAAILAVGLIGILALFPVAIRTGLKVVEDSNAVVIAQSVAEAIRDGIRNRKRYFVGRGARSTAIQTYFVFKHDGVMDPIPVDADLERPHHDYYILLPRYEPGRVFAGGERTARLAALKVAKTFVYPETDQPPSGGGDAFLADNDADDHVVTVGDEEIETFRVEKVYSLGNNLILGDPDGPGILKDMQLDTLRQYSYAFAIRASYHDANVFEGKTSFEPANKLYHVRLMIFRKFQVSEHMVDYPKPVYELEFEVSL